MAKFFGYVFILCSVLLLGSYAYLNQFMSTTVKTKASRIIEIPKGSGLHSVGRTLKNEGIVDNVYIFVKMGQFQGLQNKIKYGEYKIEPTDSYQRVYNKITGGENLKYEITFIEGDHQYKYGELLEDKKLGKKEEFLRLTSDSKFIKKLLGEDRESLEGYLFPDTYYFSKNDTEKIIIETMVKKFLKTTSTIKLSYGNLNRHQIVTLASIIEKETGAAHERPLISSVFHNRMKKKMRLQTDPTIIYGILRKTGVETRNIRKKDIMARTDYNTYVIKGLPPGPIGNPGLESIKAAIRPKDSRYLFFVSRNNGTHVFTETYTEHQKAVREFQLNAKARSGKSWRDLNKEKKKK